MNEFLREITAAGLGLGLWDNEDGQVIAATLRVGETDIDPISVVNWATGDDVEDALDGLQRARA